MQDAAVMARDPTNLTHTERMAALMRELSSSTCVTKAETLLDVIRHEYLDVLAVRDMAARRHGLAVPAADPLPNAHPNTKPESPAEPQTNPIGAAGESITTLIKRYQTDERSPYHKLLYATRTNYETCLTRIEHDVGGTRLIDIKPITVRGWYEAWSAGGKISMAHSLVAILRIMFNFGSSVLEDEQCERVSGFMHHIRTSSKKPNESGETSEPERLTEEHVKAIIQKAHAMGMASIALAQALQFDCKIGQKDCIGEWVPQREKGGDSDIIDGNMKWLRGLRWEEIDSNLILHHTTKKGADFDLRKAPKVMAELERIGKLPKTGPILINEKTRLPYITQQFRRLWRVVADAAGVPKHIKNMDSRIGREKPGEVDAEFDDEKIRASEGVTSEARH